MNGFEFLSALRSDTQYTRIPCLIMTTETKPEVKAQGKKLGLTGWIVKPFTPSKLQDAIKQILRLR
jgi:two-component system chemotaxis response regulator CheY